MKTRMKTKALVSMLLAIALLYGTLAGCANAGDPGGGEETQAALDVETKLTNTKLEGEKDDSKHTITTLLTFTPEPAGHGGVIACTYSQFSITASSGITPWRLRSQRKMGRIPPRSICCR